MLAALALSFFEERVVVVQYERGLIGWIVIGLIAEAGSPEKSRAAPATAASPTSFLGLVGSVLTAAGSS